MDNLSTYELIQILHVVSTTEEKKAFNRHLRDILKACLYDQDTRRSVLQSIKEYGYCDLKKFPPKNIKNNVVAAEPILTPEKNNVRSDTVTIVDCTPLQNANPDAKREVDQHDIVDQDNGNATDKSDSSTTASAANDKTIQIVNGGIGKSGREASNEQIPLIYVNEPYHNVPVLSPTSLAAGALLELAGIPFSNSPMATANQQHYNDLENVVQIETMPPGTPYRTIAFEQTSQNYDTNNYIASSDDRGSSDPQFNFQPHNCQHPEPHYQLSLLSPNKSAKEHNGAVEDTLQSDCVDTDELGTGKNSMEPNSKDQDVVEDGDGHHTDDKDSDVSSIGSADSGTSSDSSNGGSSSSDSDTDDDKDDNDNENVSGFNCRKNGGKWQGGANAYNDNGNMSIHNGRPLPKLIRIGLQTAKMGSSNNRARTLSPVASTSRAAIERESRLKARNLSRTEQENTKSTKCNGQLQQSPTPKTGKINGGKNKSPRNGRTVKGNMSTGTTNNRGRRVPKLKKTKCKICEKVFIVKKHFKRHIREKHTNGEKQHKCIICGEYATHRPENLKKHLLTHDKKKNYIRCKFCGRSYATYYMPKHHKECNKNPGNHEKQQKTNKQSKLKK